MDECFFVGVSMNRKSIIFLSGVLFLMSFNFVNAEIQKLSSDEVRVFFSDHTMNGVRLKNSKEFKSYWNPDGTVQWKSGWNSREGEWWINELNGTRCVKWKTKKRTFCPYLVRNEDGTHSLIHAKNGRRLVTIKSREKGNDL